MFIFLVVLITGLYQTFSLYTSSGNLSIIDGLKTYRFILNANNAMNSVTIPANTNKNLAITVSNSESIKLQYGIYYSSLDVLTDVTLGYLDTSEYPAKGLINANEDYIVTIRVENNSSSNVTIDFGISYGLESGGDLTLETNQYWLDIIRSGILLNEVEPGSYVAYTGNNGCSGEACNGQNANYVDDTNMGYCYDSNYKFKVNGWRVGYIKDGSVYLVSAGSPECMCTDRDGVSSNSSCSTDEETEGLPQHLMNLNNSALKYCNSAYAYGGTCNSTSSWNMNEIDFQNITGSSLSDDSSSGSSCYGKSESTACGYGNDLIDNGGGYWVATSHWAPPYGFYWYPHGRQFLTNTSHFSHGLRPVLRLDSSVLAIGGTGIYQDPYRLSVG